MLLILSLAAAAVMAEPPVNSYLPPGQGRSQPSSQYGAPSSSSRFNSGSSLSTRNGATSGQFGGRNIASSRFNSIDTLSTSYGAPSMSSSRLGGSNSISTQYGAPSGTSGRFSAPSTQYGAPSGASSRFNAPSTQYGAPSGASSQFNALSNTYGAPSAFSRNTPSAEYGVPNAGYRGAQEDSRAEPANYEFNYEVQDAESGAEFGHEETRQDESAQGSYRVLLPDGRLQIVEYQADEEGYKPEIRYEDTALSRDSQGPYPASRAGQRPY
ncbi:unnamed protein product [Timema podura]|uniref:Pro-resilin n=1 Tax=Timema podura TaxID=61482 RepID=A0ABN7NSF1_TIMPD|nr:unnamed protein product [Timema podura]